MDPKSEERQQRSKPRASDSSPHVHPPLAFQGTGVGGHGLTTPTPTPGSQQPSSTAPSSAERSSPSARPLPATTAARRVLIPRRLHPG
ncbi:hypothetical protein F5Y17DRAFT_450516 [Xylariaceae sp. FL0594]|nr:hypothetical protein F5Y17DRAFT_450516 [Xylariaceae sp. FL0594]